MRLNNIHVSSKEPVNPSLWVDTSGKKPILKGYVNGQYVILSEDVPDNVITKDMIVDSLESDATDVPLSAAQGKALNSKISDSAPYIVDFSNISGKPTSEEIDAAIGGWDNFRAAIESNRLIIILYGSTHTFYYLISAYYNTGSSSMPESITLSTIHSLWDYGNGRTEHNLLSFTIVKKGVDLSFNVSDISVPSEEILSHLLSVLDLKQDITDDTLSTTDKTVTGAINEVNQVVKTKQDKLKAGTGVEITSDNTVNVTLDTTVFKVVASLPESPAAGDENKIHLVPAESTEEGNIYTEYVFVNGKWEEFGTYRSEVDLTPYLKKTDAESTYQKINDSTLATNAKTVVGAINELKSSVDTIPDNSYMQYLHKVYENYGAVYNAETGYWEYGDLKDMTEEDCFLAAFYALEQIQGENTISFILDRYKNLSARTYFTKITPKGSQNETRLVLDSCFAQSNKLEYLKLSDTPTSSFLYIENIKGAFRDCPKLRKIEDILTIYTSSNNDVKGAFMECSALKDVKIRLMTGANVDISFEDSRLLSYESIKFLVENARNTADITVTVHPTTYSYLTGTAQPTEEVGGTTEEWQALVTTAQGKQISFM